MDTNIKNVEALMQRYEYNSFEQKLYDGIVDYLKSFLHMDITDNISVVKFDDGDKSMIIDFDGSYESYKIRIKPNLINVLKFVKRDLGGLNGESATFKKPVWRLAIPATVKGFRRSSFSLHPMIHDFDNKHLEDARDMLIYALNTSLDIGDDCSWLKASYNWG